MRFQRKVRRGHKRQMEERTERVRHAEEYVFRKLEERWSDVLHGRRIPREQRKMLRADPNFRILVAKRLAGEPLVFTDRDLVPDQEVRADGVVVDRRLEELGPTVFGPRCRLCDTESVERPGDVCEDCRKLYGEADEEV